MPPEVTVVVATKDRPSVIPRALESVRAQGGVTTETIVVDDGSSPAAASELREACERLAEIRLLRLEASRGPSAARNAGLAVARGRFFCTLDDDNEFCSGKLEAQVSMLNAAGTSDAVSVTGVELLAEGRAPEQSFPRLPGPRRLDGVRSPLSILPAGVFVHTYLLPTDLMRRVGSYEENLRWGEHTELFLRLRRIATFLGVDAIGTRVHRGTELRHASRDWHAKAEGIRRIMELHADDFRAAPSMRAEWLDVLGVTLLREDRRAEATRAFASAAAARPLRVSALRHLVGAATHTEWLLGGSRS
jgi:glycosyltransferase involved in cell wall biosynthesis